MPCMNHSSKIRKQHINGRSEIAPPVFLSFTLLKIEEQLLYGLVVVLFQYLL